MMSYVFCASDYNKMWCFLKKQTHMVVLYKTSTNKWCYVLFPWYTSIKKLTLYTNNFFEKRERKSENVSEQRNPTFENPFFAKHLTTLGKLYTPSKAPTTITTITQNYLKMTSAVSDVRPGFL
jgi:hypothetical protein